MQVVIMNPRIKQKKEKKKVQLKLNQEAYS